MGVNRKFLDRLLSGLSDKNIEFKDLERLLIDFGFKEKIKGSHHIFVKINVIEIINLQPLKDGKAKSYQVKQARNILLKHKLHREV